MGRKAFRPMHVINSIAQMRQIAQEAKRPLGLVPTMGALHEGHLSLVRKARTENVTLVVSIFVNPAQFAPHEDFQTYPRDMERDLDLLCYEKSDIVFAPPTEEIYSQGFDTWVDMGSLGERLEGQHRPGHFRGVATVVLKLLRIVRPDRAYFGQKDGQQSVVIRKMVKDLDLDVDIVVVSTVRERDGLALSSRNVYLTPEQRRAAPVIYRALSRARELWEDGTRDATHLRSEVERVLRSEPLVDKIDYVSVADAATLEELDEVDRPAMVSTAVHIGRTRLIDNVLIG